MSDGRLRVLVVDDQQLVREGLTALLELTDGVEVVGSAGDGAQALELIAGARGYLTKDAGRAEISLALRAAAGGQSLFDPAVTARLAEAISRPAAQPRRDALPDGLTQREAEVLGQIARGRTNGEIAAALFVAETTVKTHINNAFAKIGARNRTEAAGYALRHGL